MGVDLAGWNDAHQGTGYLVRFLMILAFLLGAAIPLPADPVTATQALAAVQTWLSRTPNPLGARLSSRVAGIQAYSDSSGTPLYYVASLKSGGFVIVSGDDLVEPIIGFFPGGRFDPSPGNPLGALVKRDLPARLGEVRAQSANARKQGKSALSEPRLARARGKWASLMQRRPAAKVLPSSQQTSDLLAGDINDSLVSDIWVAPLVQTRWDQADAGGVACYNYYTPPFAAGSAANYPCGCVATATAQLLRYHKWPTRAVGVRYYAITVDDVVRLYTLRGGDGSGGPYVWSDMPLAPDASTPDAQRRAIGALTADVGAAVRMNYTAFASGASMEEARNRLIDLFGYSNAIRGAYTNYNNQNQDLTPSLPAMVNPNLDAGLPVLLGVLDDWRVLAHAIVCDGYGTSGATLYHHLNMGWAGLNDGWYNLPTIGAGHGFCIVDECIYNIFPTGSGEIISGRVTDSLGAPLAGATVTASRTGATTLTLQTNDRGIYAFKNVPANTGYVIAAQAAGAFLPPPRRVATGQSVNNSRTVGNVWGVNFQTSAVRLPVVQFPVLNSSWPENAGPAYVDVALDIPSARTLTIDYAVTAGTATAGIDFRPTTGTLQFAPGQLQASVPVELIDNTLHDPDRTIMITLAHPSAGCYLGLSDSHTLTIRDDELTLGEALDCNRLAWRTEGDAPWFPELTVSADGLDAAQSGQIGPGQSSTLYAYVPGPGTFTFRWRLEAQPGDVLAFCDNGTTVSTITDVTSFTQKTIKVVPDLHLLRWVLTRPADSPSGSTRAWVDQVTWDGTGLPNLPAPSPYKIAGLLGANTRVEAEDFDEGGNAAAYFDTTPGNSGVISIRTGDVDIDDCADGNNICVRNIESSEWLGYTLSPPGAGPYTIQLRVASDLDGTSCWLDLDGVRLTGNISVPNTGNDWDAYQTVTLSHVNLPAGTHFLRLRTDTGGFAINYMQFTAETLGVLRMTLAPNAAKAAGARWRPVGTATWLYSGALARAFPAGPCQVEFKVATPWEPPAPQTYMIVAGQTLTTTATYTRQTSGLRVTITPPEAAAEGARWRRVGTEPWLNSGEAETGLAPGTYTIEYSDIPGWIKPGNGASIVKDYITEVTMSYIGLGSLTAEILPPEAVAAGARWRRNVATSWLDSGTTETNVPAMSQWVQFLDISGWDTPASKQVRVMKGQTAYTSGTYVRQTGSLQVTLNPTVGRPSGTSWRRVGTTTWLPNGFTEANILTGSYTLEFTSVPDWTAPAAVSVTITKNQLTHASADYVRQTGALKGTILPPAVVAEGAQWLYSGAPDWVSSGVTASNLPTGAYTVDFLPIPGWQTPASLTTTVTQNALTTFTVTYLRQPGALSVTLAPPEAVSAGARWRRVGTTPWLASGASKANLTSGSTSVEFRSITGWTAPGVKTVNIPGGTTATLPATYMRQAGSLQVTLGPAQAVTAGASWRRVGTTVWKKSGDTETGIATGLCTVEFKTVSGWIAPAGMSVMINSGQTTQLSRSYRSKSTAIPPRDWLGY